MGKQQGNQKELSKEEYDDKLGSSIDKLVDNGISEEDIKLFIDDFKTMYTVKKKEVSQSENTTYVSETPLSDTQVQREGLQSASKEEGINDIKPLIKNPQYNPDLVDNQFNLEYVENPKYKFKKGHTFKKNKEFDPSIPVSVFNQEFIDVEYKKGYSKLEKATPKQLELLKEFESLNSLPEEELNAFDEKIKSQKKGDFGFFTNIKNTVVSTPYIGTTKTSMLNPFFNPENVSKVDKKEELKKSRIKELQKDFVKDLSDEDKNLLNSFIKSKKFKEDTKLKLITDDINKIDEKLLPATKEIEEIDIKLNEFQKEKNKLVELAKTTDNIDSLKAKYEEINNTQADLIEVRTNKYNDANLLFEERVKKLNEIEDHTSSVGTIEQELDLLKRNYDFIDNVTTRAGLGFAELGQNIGYLIDKNNLRIERNDLKSKLKYGWHKSENPELRNDIPPQYLVGDYEFNEVEFDKETKKLKDSMISSTSVTKNILEGWRDTIRPNISVSEINSFSDVIDFTVDGIADNTATVAQLAIPFVGEALFVTNQKQGSELGLRIDDLKVRNDLEVINQKLENKFTLPIEEIYKLEKEKKALESKVMSELKIQASSSLMSVSELAFSKLFGEAKRLKVGKRILSDATKQELKKEVNRTVKDWLKYSAKGVLEVTKDGAEEGFLDEFLTNVTQNTIKKYYIGDDKITSIFDNSIDAIAGGLSVGSVMSASPRIAGQFISHISSHKKRNKVYNNIKKISELEKFINDNNDLDKTLLNETKLKITKLKYDNHKMVNSSIEGFDNLSIKEKKELLRLSSEAVALDISIDKLNEKKSLSQIEYAMLNEMEDKLQKIDIRKEEISSREIVAKVNGKEVKFTSETFEDFIKVDENVKDIKNGKIDLSFKNQDKSYSLLENRIKEVFSTATEKTKDFASSISENVNDISTEVAKGVVSVKEGSTEILIKEDDNGDIRIESVKTDEKSKGKGSARKVLEKTITIADEKNSRLVLDVVPENDNVSKEKLTSFYESLGFVKDGETRMVREPKKDNSFNTIDNIVENANNSEENKKTNTKSNTTTTTIETTKDTYDVRVEDGEIKIKPKLSKNVSKTEAVKVKKQYIKEADFTGKETDFTGMESASDNEINEFIADNSESPIEVATALNSVRKSKLDKSYDGSIDKETAIAIAVYDGVDKKDFIRHSGHPDANNTYFKKNKEGKVRGIERIVEELQSAYPHFDFDITDVTDFISSTNREDLNNMIKNSKSDIEIKLEDRFKKLTGLKASETIITDVIDTDSTTETTKDNFNDTGTHDDVPFQTSSKELLNLEGSALSSLVNRLLKTGLAKAVKILSDKGISDFLNSIGIKTVQLQQNTELKEIKEKGITLTPNGFVYEGVVYLNRDKVKGDTPIHEFGHLWNEYAIKNIPDVYNRGLELIKGTEYHKEVQNNTAYEHLSKEQKLEEALAQAIGEKGTKIVDESRKEKFANWFKNLFTKIAKGLGITDAKKNIDAKINEIEKFKEDKSNELRALLDKGEINQDTFEKRIKFLKNNAVKKINSLNDTRSKKISELTLDEFTNLVSGELLAGKQISNNGKTENNFNKIADVSNIDVIIAEQKAIKETRQNMYKMFRNKNFYIKNIQKELQKYIRKNIDSKRLNELRKSELNKLIDVVASTKNKKKLLKVLSDVDEIILKTDNRIILKKINKIIGGKLYKKEAGRIKANRIDEPSVFVLSKVKEKTKIKKQGKQDTLKNEQRISNKIIELIDEKSALKNKEWTETDNGLEYNELSVEEILTIEALDISIKILEGKSNSLEQITKNEMLLEALYQINYIYKTGRSNLLALKEEAKKIEDKKINDIREDLNPDGKKSELSLTQLQKNNKQGFKNFFERIIFNIYQGKGAGSLDSMASLLSRKGGENRDDSAIVQFVNSLKRDETRKKTRIKILADYLDNLRNERFGSLKKANRVFSKKIDLELSKPEKDTDNRVTVTSSFTQAELLNVWMNFKNKTLREGLAQNGFTEDVVSEIDKILPDSLKNYGEDLYLVYEDLYKDANDVYKRMNYHSLGKPEFYAGKVYRSDTTVKEDTDALLGGKANIRTTGYDSQKARTINNKPIEAVDVNFLVNKAIQESSHYVAFAENHRLFTKILKDNSIKKAIELNNKGKSDLILSALNFYKVKDLEQGGDRGIPIVDFFARNIVKATLALKVKIGVTQTISFINGSMDMPTGLTPIEFASYYNPKDVVSTFKELLSKSDYLRNRYDIGGIDNAMLGLQDLSNQSKIFQNESLEGQRKEVARFYKAMLDYSMVNVKVGDAIGVMGAIPMYNAWLDKYSKKYSKEVAEKKAMAKFESSIDRSQQSTSAFGKSQWQRHPVMKYFMMFATSPIQNHQNAMYHFRELRRGLMKGQDNAKGTNLRNGLAFLNYQFVQPVLYTYIAGALAGSLSTALGFGNDEPDDADKDILRAFIMGNSNAIPYIGLLSQTILENALNKQDVFAGVTKSPVFDNANKVMTYWQKAYTAKTKDTSAKYTRKALSETAGILAGVPKFSIDTFNDMNDVYWNDEVDIKVKFLKAIGYSDYIIKQSRTGRMTKVEANRKRYKEKMKYEKSKIKRHKTPKVYKKNQRK